MSKTKPSIFEPNRVFVVAEIGKNFIQSEQPRAPSVYFDNAKKLVTAAKAAGADAVKFQTHNLEDEQAHVSVESPHFKGIDRYQWVQFNTEVTALEAFWKPLKAYCDIIGITFFSTPMSRGAAITLRELDPPFWKVASSDILDFVLLDYLASTRKPIIIPAGMSSLEELDLALAFLRQRKSQIALLHAISRYPYPPEDSNLSTIPFFQERYSDLPIGFSQNSPWVEPALTAVALGAVLLEQHFTLDRGLWGPDHKVSMMPNEFSSMVHGVRKLQGEANARKVFLKRREVQKYLGERTKVLQQGEAVFRPFFRKSLVAGRDIPQGTVLHAEDIYALRPQGVIGGLPSEAYSDVVGRRAIRPLRKYDAITRDVLVDD